MYVDPFWCGFLLGLVFSVVALIALAYNTAGRRKK